MIPSNDATENLESYFPVLFPFGKGEPKTRGIPFAVWIRHVIEVENSKFSTNLDFIFFTNSVHQRKRISGLSMFANIKKRCSDAIIEVKSLLSLSRSKTEMISKIDRLLENSALSVSYENLKGSGAFWASMGRKAWTYLVVFGPCNFFLTMSAADSTDPFVFMNANSNLSFEQASKLTPKERANILASNP